MKNNLIERLPLQAYNYVGISTGMNFVKRLANANCPPLCKPGRKSLSIHE